MSYAMVGFVALFVVLIINSDIIFIRDETSNIKHIKAYRCFLYSVMFFCFFDGMWGVLEEVNSVIAIFIDTSLFFAAMAISVLFWANYVNKYVAAKTKMNRFWNTFLTVTSFVIFTYTMVIVIINIFPNTRILFDFGKEAAEHDQNGYDPNICRYILFGLQAAMFLLTSIVAFYNGFKVKANLKHRHFAISGFGIVMSLAILAQIFFPFIALYSIGLVLGICVIHTFVVASEKDEKRRLLNESLAREKKHEEEIFSTKSLIYNDPLTGAKSKHAYVEMEDDMDLLISFKTIKRFAVVVFDVNGLKHINDTLGHEYGDIYIKDCYKTIVDYFNGATVYRFGGDEFVVILKDLLYERRNEMLEKFDKKIEENLGKNLPVVSSGMSEFDPEKDNTYRAVFERADELMYNRKKYLKSITTYLSK
ncbi:MAG: GGDEF domain-containing protein [Acholeplasmatales bacterium]|nr:GGDEF domain-containing protein [Acholeplasmatales bacterium]